MEDSKVSSPSLVTVARVRNAFLIFPSGDFLAPLHKYQSGARGWESLVSNAVDGLHGVVSAGGLPFELIQHSVLQRRFDSFHMAERIRALPYERSSLGLTGDDERKAYSIADERMKTYMDSGEGRDFMRDSVVIELDRRLRSDTIRAAAQELLVQTLISTWSVFESFARAFIIDWINADPRRVTPVLASADLRDYFGKQVVDIQVIDDHGFNLAGSMGTILFRGRRLDALGSIRSVMKALFNSGEVQATLGDDMWLLNQRRHLFVHNRGSVDADYLRQTGEQIGLGERLILDSHDIEKYLLAVQKSMVAILEAAES